MGLNGKHIKDLFTYRKITEDVHGDNRISGNVKVNPLTFGRIARTEADKSFK